MYGATRFSGGVSGAGREGPVADESEAADEGKAVGEGCSPSKDLRGFFCLPRKGNFQANVPRLPL